MSEDWIGCIVSLDCGEVLGTYQGQVSAVNKKEQSLSIIKAFRNGILCNVKEITISATDIKNLEIIKSQNDAQTFPEVRHTPVGSSEPSPVPGKKVTYDTTPMKPKVEHKGNDVQRRNSFHESRVGNGQYLNGNGTGLYPCASTTDFSRELTPTKDQENFRRRTNSASETKSRKQSTPKKIENRRKPTREDLDCFSAPVDSFLDDFDFEKNLALFDKAAVMEKITSEKGGNAGPTLVQSNVKKQKYRCDENVLHSGPVVYKLIKVPPSDSGGKMYVTDMGLLIPSISAQLHTRLLSVAESHGFHPSRQLEAVGRSASEMVLQLLGGSHRFGPQNSHQKPSVVVLCGPHMQGAQGLNCARQLSNHNVQVTVFVPNFLNMKPWLAEELKLFELADGKRTASTNDLPATPVDMIINCLDDHETTDLLRPLPWYTAVVDWSNSSHAHVLAINPPVQGGAIDTKWSLTTGLPLSLSDKCGQVYLCDLGFPSSVFKEVGITYKSPFGHKFVIPLHEKT